MKQKCFYPLLFSFVIFAVLPLLAEAQSAPPGSRLVPAPLPAEGVKPNALVLRQVKREDIEEHVAVGRHASTLTHFVVNGDQNLRQLGDAYPHSAHLKGAVFSGRILDQVPMGVALSTVYLEEKIARDRGITRDHAWSLGADTQLFSDRFHLYGEYAWSRRNSAPVAAPLHDDGAYKLQLNYRPGDISFWGFPLDWSMGIKHRRVGPFFHSPAVPEERPDVSLVEASTHLGWRGLMLDTLVARERRNFESPSPRSPQQIRRAQLKGEYRLPHLGGASWLGAPRFTLLLSKRERKMFEAGTSSATLKAGFSHRIGAWNWSQTFSWHDQSASRRFYAHSRATVIESQFNLLDNRLSLAPTFQHRYNAAAPGTFEQNRWQAGIDTCAILIPEKLKGQWRVEVQRMGSELGTRPTYSTSGDLHWQLTRRRAQIPGVQIFLEGRYQSILKQISGMMAFIDDYRVLVGVAFN